MKEEEIRKLHIINCSLEGKCTVAQAASILKLSERRIKQLKKEVKLQGATAVIHGNRGRKPAHSINEQLANRIISLKSSHPYQDANFLHFKELLAKHEAIEISYSSLHAILKAANIPSPKKHRKPKKHHRRKRKASAGMMLQADGTPHDWFADTKKYSLHGFIDDATGSITGLYMCQHECLLGYLEVTRQTLENFGLPLSLYPDKYSVFFPSVQKKEQLSIEEQLNGADKSLTQFGRIMDELGIEMFPASSPQAKGRIERLWQTLQSRLVTEFRIRNIRTMQQANAFFPAYITTYNAQFAVKAQSDRSAFLPLPPKVDLDQLLCVKIPRVTDNAGVFSISNCKFAVTDKSIPPRAKIIVLLSKNAGMKVLYKDRLYPVSHVDFLNKHQDIPDGRTLSIVAQQLILDYFLKNVKAA